MNDDASTNRWGMSFHHLGLAVREPEAANTFLYALGYRVGESVYDPLQNVHLQLCDHTEMPDVEIISPAKGAGPLDKLLSPHRDGLVYHMCYFSPNLAATLGALEMAPELRVFCVSPPKPAVLFGGKRVSFYVVANVGLIEILEGAD